MTEEEIRLSIKNSTEEITKRVVEVGIVLTFMQIPLEIVEVDGCGPMLVAGEGEGSHCFTFYADGTLGIEYYGEKD